MAIGLEGARVVGGIGGVGEEVDYNATEEGRARVHLQIKSLTELRFGENQITIIETNHVSIPVLCYWLLLINYYILRPKQLQLNVPSIIKMEKIE